MSRLLYPYGYLQWIILRVGLVTLTGHCSKSLGMMGNSGLGASPQGQLYPCSHYENMCSLSFSISKIFTHTTENWPLWRNKIIDADITVERGRKEKYTFRIEDKTPLSSNQYGLYFIKTDRQPKKRKKESISIILGLRTFHTLFFVSEQ